MDKLVIDWELVYAIAKEADKAFDAGRHKDLTAWHEALDNYKEEDVANEQE